MAPKPGMTYSVDFGAGQIHSQRASSTKVGAA